MVLPGEGESFVHPRPVELVAAAKDAGFEVILYTNGTLLDESSLRALVALSLDVLKISM
jgi:MoaA/NifB/PqqE/SkfB family radical SAM enzyme